MRRTSCSRALAVIVTARASHVRSVSRVATRTSSRALVHGTSPATSADSRAGRSRSASIHGGQILELALGEAETFAGVIAQAHEAEAFPGALRHEAPGQGRQRAAQRPLGAGECLQLGVNIGGLPGGALRVGTRRTALRFPARSPVRSHATTVAIGATATARPSSEPAGCHLSIAKLKRKSTRHPANCIHPGRAAETCDDRAERRIGIERTTPNTIGHDQTHICDFLH